MTHKIEHCFITPTRFINNSDTGSKSDFLLVLSHLLDDKLENEYSQAVLKFKETGKKIYLDNGLFENGSPEGVDSLINKIMLLNPNLVFAPDFLYDSKLTEEAFEDFEEKVRLTGYKGRIGFVVQAKDMMEYCRSFKWALKNPKIDLIGMSILSIPKAFGNEDITSTRIIAMEMLDFYLDIDKDVHLLGLGGSLRDLVEAKKYPWVKSNDSSSAFQTGYFNKVYDGNLEVSGGKIEEKVDFDYDGQLSTRQLNNILQNINIIKNVLQ